MRRVKPHTRATTSGMLLASAGIPVAVADRVLGPLHQLTPALQGAVALTVLLLITAGFGIVGFRALGRLAATLGVLGTVGLGVPYLTKSPFTTLLVLVVTTGALSWLWGVGMLAAALPALRARPLYSGQAQGAAMVGLALWLIGALSNVERSAVDTLVVGYALGLAGLLSLEWAWRERHESPSRAIAMLMAAALAAVYALLFWGQWWWTVSGLAAVAVSATSLIRRPEVAGFETSRWWEPLLGHPERLLAGSFLVLSVGGAALLALPQSSSSGRSIGLLDALFTSVSAVCVTGLIVLDTPVAFTEFGQLMILALIQVGGIGIMTLSTAALWALGQRMSLGHETAVATLMDTKNRGELFRTARRILILTFSAEAAGAVLLTFAFVQHGDSFAMALWRGTFTAISAFCNAGFALQSDSLIPYQGAPLVLHVVGLLIILGGLSPGVVFALPALARGRSTPVAAQVKLALAATGVLLVLGFGFILAFEWQHSLAELSVSERIHNAWFQSVTLRTAGFNSVDFTLVRPPSLTLMILWMFIGGNPGGTAGGVKTTTIAVLVLSVIQAIRGQRELEAFGKRIGERTRARAAVVVSVAMATGIAALVVIQLTQRMPTEVAVFEVVSAMGTVGLSTGGTALLDGVGKLVIMLCMFVGRVGGLTLLMFLSSRQLQQTVGRPEEEVGVG